jgi:predicted lipoprotein with Yx(FWY)xxD motif
VFGRERVLRALAWAAAPVACASLAVGCGGGDAGTAAEPPVHYGKGKSAHLSTGTPEAHIGKVLVSRWGYTLYAFTKDVPFSGKSACYGRCAHVWPPLITVGPPTRLPEKDVAVGKLGAIKRKDGRLQVTYDGHPLYKYKNDYSAESSGIGKRAFGGRWLVIQPTGKLDDY